MGIVCGHMSIRVSACEILFELVIGMVIISILQLNGVAIHSLVYGYIQQKQAQAAGRGEFLHYLHSMKR